MTAAAPISVVLPSLLEVLCRERRVALVAPPGAGKTTRVPLAVLDAPDLLSREHPGVLVLEPRRLAARAMAGYVARQRGVTLGGEVGYQVRLDRRVGPDTRLTFVTEGILTRRLQADPLLEGVGCVILDEFHERSVHSDLAIALLREVCEVREDLALVVMSATLEAEAVAKYLGCPVITSQGRLYPLDIRYPLQREPPDQAQAVAQVLAALVQEEGDDGGDVLVFLSGAGAIHRTLVACQRVGQRHGLELLPLYGALPAREQDRAIARGAQRRVIFATNIAETSLTVEGVSAVIDTGRVKRVRHDSSSGLDRLEEEWVSQAEATQRAGRAGRVRPGRAVRLWPRALEHRFTESAPAAIARVSLTQPVLEVVAWSGDAPSRFSWFEQPPRIALDAATAELERLGAIKQAGGDNRPALTEVGQRLLRLPLPPRLGRVLLEARDRGCLEEGCLACSLLGERDIVVRHQGGTLPVDDDLWRRVEVVARAAQGDARAGRAQGFAEVHVGRAQRVLAVRDRLRSLMGPPTAPKADEPEQALRRALLAGYADRICFVRPRNAADDREDAVMVGGQPLTLARESAVRDAQALVALEIAGARTARWQSRGSGVARRGLIRMAARVEIDWLREDFPERFSVEHDLAFDEDSLRVSARRVERFDGLKLDEQPVPWEEVAEAGRVAAILAEAATGRLEQAFGLDRDQAQFLHRLRTLGRWRPELRLFSPDADDERFLEILSQISWGKRSFGELRQIDLPQMLRAYLEQAQLQALETLAPARAKVPSGHDLRLDYAHDPPVLAVKLQQMFGQQTTPAVNGGRTPVVLHLLAPNGRPAQITQDLESFWRTTYPQVRKELRARYAKHSWPEDPLAAEATWL